MLTVPRGEIAVDGGQHPGTLASCGRFESTAPLLFGVRQRCGDQFLLGGKVRIETAMRQSRLAHDVGNTNSIEAMLAESGGRSIQNAAARLRLAIAAPAGGVMSIIIL
jgi:hypothetical protein